MSDEPPFTAREMPDDWGANPCPEYHPDSRDPLGHCARCGWDVEAHRDGLT